VQTYATSQNTCRALLFAQSPWIVTIYGTWSRVADSHHRTTGQKSNIFGIGCLHYSFWCVWITWTLAQSQWLRLGAGSPGNCGSILEMKRNFSLPRSLWNSMDIAAWTVPRLWGETPGALFPAGTQRPDRLGGTPNLGCDRDVKLSSYSLLMNAWSYASTPHHRLSSWGDA